MFERLGPGRGLVVCPTVYCGYGDEDYIARLGRGIDPRVDLFWTGRAICSATLDLADAATFARSAVRPATYWDNYPVNDVAMTHELHIGPYRGRDPHLWRFATGVIANGMELFESTKVALATIADYLADPIGYDPEASWRVALRDVAGDADADAYALFADNVRSSCLCAEDAPTVSRALASFGFRAARVTVPRPRPSSGLWRTTCWLRPGTCCVVPWPIAPSWTRDVRGSRRSRPARRHCGASPTSLRRDGSSRMVPHSSSPSSRRSAGPGSGCSAT